MSSPSWNHSLLPPDDQIALPRRGFRFVLALGFGGMFALMAAVGIHSISVLGSIERSMAASDRLFLDKNHALESIRSAFYLYGAEFHQFLANPDAEEAQARLASLKALRVEIESNLNIYARGLSGEELAALEDLRRNMTSYLATHEPIFSWAQEQRRARGRAWLSRETAEQRVHIVQITDKISAINERRYRTASELSARLMDAIRGQAILLLVAATGVGILLAVAVIAYVVRLERTLRLRYQHILQAQAELHELSAKLVDAQEEERRSIARELHDEVGQTMSALLVDLGNAAAIAPADNDELKLRIQSIRKLTEDSVSAVRNMALLLRPSMLDDFGLVPALNWQAREVSRRTGMRVEVSAEDLPDELSDEHRTCVYRVVQEALHNAARHAQATQVRVVVRQEPDRLLLVVQDNGRGFDPSGTRGLGLLGMEERVRHIGGVFQIESEHGRGALIKVQLPLADLHAPPPQTLA